MKNILLFVAVSITVLSCGSDNLSNSKAVKILKECLKDAPIERKAILQTGEVTFNIKNKSNKLGQYEKLRNDGYIEMTEIKKKSSGGNDPLSQWMKNIRKFNITVTRKTEDYILKAPEKANFVQVRIFQYEVDKVLEVQEFPAKNSARVKVQYKVVDLTPFAILASKDPPGFWVKDRTMKKTSNGWKYCDNY